jgi:hypothetical protein
MSRKQLSFVVLVVVLAATLSALVAYRFGIKRSQGPASIFNATLDGRGGCVDMRQASLHTGENGCISGRILRVFTSRSGSTFLDFCQDYHECPFTSVIFGSDRSRFGNLGALQGEEVEIVGQITTYGGRAEIIIHDPKQIRLAH